MIVNMLMNDEFLRYKYMDDNKQLNESISQHHTIKMALEAYKFVKCIFFNITLQIPFKYLVK